MSTSGCQRLFRSSGCVGYFAAVAVSKMSTRVLWPSSGPVGPLDTLERMLNTTTLTTKRVLHQHILEVGGRAAGRERAGPDSDRERALREVVQGLERRHRHDMKTALCRLRDAMTRDHALALDTLTQQHDELTKRIGEQVECLKEERIREVTRSLKQDSAHALSEQWEKCQRVQMAAVEAARAACREGMLEICQAEKAKAISEAVAAANESAESRERLAVGHVRVACQQAAARNAEQVAKQHAVTLLRQQDKLVKLEEKCRNEQKSRKDVEQAFMELQADYRRFIDYSSDGKFHSDYMMRLRQFD